MEYVNTKITAKPENIKAFGKIVAVTSDNILADASQIWDSAQGKFQSEINATGGGGKGGVDPSGDTTFSGNNTFSGDNSFSGKTTFTGDANFNNTTTDNATVNTLTVNKTASFAGDTTFSGNSSFKKVTDLGGSWQVESTDIKAGDVKTATMALTEEPGDDNDLKEGLHCNIEATNGLLTTDYYLVQTSGIKDQGGKVEVGLDPNSANVGVKVALYDEEKGETEISYLHYDGLYITNDTDNNDGILRASYSNSKIKLYANNTATPTNTIELTTLAKVLNNLKLDALKGGMFVTDPITNVGLQYTEDGLDAAKISDHFKSLLAEDEETSGLTPMYLGKFDQGTINSTTGKNDNAIDYSISRAVSKDVLAVPFIGCTFTIKAPEGYSVQIHYNPYLNMWPYTLASTSEWLSNGDTFTMPNEPDNGTTPNTAIQFKLDIKYKTDNQPNLLKTVQSLVDNGDIALLYKGSDVFSDHIHQEDRAKNVSAYQTVYQLENVGNIPFFGFLTDIHSDAVRYERFLKYCDYLGVNAAILGGDYTISNATDGFNYLYDIASKYNTKVLPVVGNHDGWEYDTRSIYNRFLKDFGYGATYYYQDIHNTRIIVLNPYETTSDSYTTEAIGQTQMNWFIETLKTTPSSYGILLCYHRPDGALAEDTTYNKFFTESTNKIDPPSAVTGIQHIIKVVDAYMLGSSISGTYTSSTGTVNYDADFTSVTSPAEFIAHVTGHYHKDLIGYYSGTTNKQLVINTVCGNGYSPQHCFSFIRDGRGPSQDGMTFFGINRTLGTVMIARIGADIDVDGKTHDIMYIPYK